MSPLDSSEIEVKLDKHEEQITQLRINQGQMEQRLNNIENTIMEIKNLQVQGNTLILSTLQNITTEMSNITTKILDLQKNKDNNKNNLLLKIVATIGTTFGVVGTYFFGKVH